MKSYTIHLIRHGITKGNEEGRYIGRTDLPLSENGVSQLKRLRRAGGYPQAQAYFTGPQKRCLETLRILYPESKPIVIDDFRECDFGDWEGKTAEEIAAGDSRFAEWISGGNGKMTPPHGEGGGAFMQRVCASFEKVAEGMMRSGVTSAVLVAPGGALMAILSAYGLPRAKFYDWMTESGTGYSVRIMPELWMRSMAAEVYSKIPAVEPDPEDSGRIIIDLARRAADEAFGTEETNPDETDR